MNEDQWRCPHQANSDSLRSLTLPARPSSHADYTTIAGLGASPLDVVFAGEMGVFCAETDYAMQGGSLDTFWRSAENFRQNTTFQWMGNAGMLWAVSQAAPLRRVVVDGDLSLYEYEPPCKVSKFDLPPCLSHPLSLTRPVTHPPTHSLDMPPSRSRTEPMCHPVAHALTRCATRSRTRSTCHLVVHPLEVPRSLANLCRRPSFHRPPP